jgi:F-type H+-transporting ATPase subunit b
MEQTIEALGGILLKAIPTALILILLYFYLKAMLFAPLDKVLKQRQELTEGARKSADRSLAAAEQKTLEYEAKFREARSAVYRDQEETRRRWLEEQAAQTARSRADAENTVKVARESIALEMASARQSLLAVSEQLADQIATALIGRRAG